MCDLSRTSPIPLSTKKSVGVHVGRVFVGGEGSVLDICYSYLSQFYHKWRSHRSSSVL